METYLLDWANLLLRWLHLITGIAWIGASFYFVMLDNSLRPPKKAADGERGVFGELWAVHGGGFYCSQKFLTGPKGEIRARVRIFEGLMPGVVTAPLNLGHTAFDVYSKGKGDNALKAVAVSVEPGVGQSVWAASRVKIAKI